MTMRRVRRRWRLSRNSVEALLHLAQGRMANARAGNPKPFSTFGQVTTITAPVGWNLIQVGHASICQ